MARVPLLNATTAGEQSSSLLQQIERSFGTTPAMFQAAANSPATLKKLWDGFATLATGKLPKKLQEQLAIAIANRNDCEYCLAAHTALGRMAGASEQELLDAQYGRSADAKTNAAIGFALKVVDRRAQISDADVAALRHAGFDDEAIVEILAHVAHNVFTNYLNVALRVPVDFPAVPIRKSA